MNVYSIEFLSTARKELASLPKKVQECIGAKIDALKADLRPQGVKATKNGEGRLRLRIGDYRVIYRVEDERLLVVVVKVGHHCKVYKQL